MNYLKIIDSLIADGHLDEAIAALTHLIESSQPADAPGCIPTGSATSPDAKASAPNSADGWSESELAELYFRRGKLYWRMGQRSRATADYMKASALDSASPATQALAQALEIESFYNHDLYNP